MRIMYIFPKWTDSLGEYEDIARANSIFPPLNLMYLAAQDEKEGHEVQIIDGEAENLSDNEIYDRVAQFNPEYVGFTSTTPSYYSAIRIASGIRALMPPEIHIVLGGSHATWIDEGEPYPFHGIICGNRIDNLDDYFPARHLIKKELYKLDGQMFTSMILQSGCPYSCVFCANKMMGKKIQKRSLRRILEEINYIVNVQGIKHISFLDEVFTINKKLVEDVCTKIIQNRWKFTWEMSTLPHMIDRTLLFLMKNAGLRRISFGLESANADVRHIINKPTTLEAHIEANRLANGMNISVNNSVMLGLPGDTRDTINETMNWVARQKDIKQATFGIAIPYPGTEMFEWAKQGKHGLHLLTEDWSKYNRYGDGGVMEVNGLTPKDLKRLQTKGLIKIYSRPRRWLPMIRRFGVKSLIRMVIK